MGGPGVVLAGNIAAIGQPSNHEFDTANACYRLIAAGQDLALSGRSVPIAAGG